MSNKNKLKNEIKVKRCECSHRYWISIHDGVIDWAKVHRSDLDVVDCVRHDGLGSKVSLRIQGCQEHACRARDLEKIEDVFSTKSKIRRNITLTVLIA